MAQFEIALETVLKNEGEYSNNPADSGGETFRGVARKIWPSWSGWAVVDELRTRPDFPACLGQDARLQVLIPAFYRENFWLFDGVKDQSIATKLLDMSVNMGKANAVRLCQRGLSSRWGFACNTDGKYGPITEAFINRAYSPDLLIELRAQSVLYYAGVVAERPTNKPFLLGWIRRAVA